MLSPRRLLLRSLGLERVIAQAVVIHTGQELRRVRAATAAVATVDRERGDRVDQALEDLEARVQRLEA